MLRTTLVFLLSSCALLFARAPAQAQASQTAEIDPIDIPPDRDPLAHAWDQPMDRGGFYLRATMGLGMQSTYLGAAPWKDDDQARRARGFASGFQLDIGGMLAPWVALHLTGHVGVLWNGTLDRRFGTAFEDGYDVRVAAYGVGPGATFFTRRDFYIGLAAGMGIAHTRYPGYNKVTDPGFFMNTVVGKDLYADRHVSFGVQMQFVYMLLGSEQTVDEARVRQFLFAMSVAYDSI